MTERAAEVMQSHVVRVGMNDPLSSVYRLFADEEISGAPVVDDTGRVVGLISMSDLVRNATAQSDAARAEADYFRDGIRYEAPVNAEESVLVEARLSALIAAEVMTKDVISVTPDATVTEVARSMLSNRIHRILVLNPDGGDEPLLGIISVFDLIRLLQ